MKIRELHIPEDTNLIADYVPEGILNLLSRDDVLTLGAFAEEEEEQLTTFEDYQEEDAASDDAEGDNLDEEETDRFDDAESDGFEDEEGTFGDAESDSFEDEDGTFEDAEAEGPDEEETDFFDEAESDTPGEEDTGVSDSESEDSDTPVIKHRRKVKSGEFVSFAVVFIYPAGAEILWLYSLPDCRTLGGASDLLNEIVEYSFRNSLDKISMLVPDKVSFPAMSEENDDLARTESFLEDCNFESCRRYAYDRITPADKSAAAILNSLPSKRGRRYSQRLLLRFLMD